MVQKGHTVTVISSNPEKRQAIESLGAIPAIGTIQDADFLTSTFTGTDGVYFITIQRYNGLIENQMIVGNFPTPG